VHCVGNPFPSWQKAKWEPYLKLRSLDVGSYPFPEVELDLFDDSRLKANVDDVIRVLSDWVVHGEEEGRVGSHGGLFTQQELVST